MSAQKSSNHGEGDPEAAEEFNTAERQFVNSERGKQKIKEGAKVRPEERADLEEAERLGRARGKNDDKDSM